MAYPKWDKDGVTLIGYNEGEWSIYQDQSGQYYWYKDGNPQPISDSYAYSLSTKGDYVGVVDMADPSGSALGASGGSSNVNINYSGADAWANFPGRNAIEKYLNWYYPYVKNLQEAGYPEFPFDLEIKAPEGEAAAMQQAQEAAQQGMFGEGGVEAIMAKIREDYKEDTLKQLQETLNARGITGSAGIELMAKVGAEGDIAMGAQEAQLRAQDWESRQAANTNFFNMQAREEDRARANLAMKYQDWATRNMYPAQTAANLAMPTAQIGQNAMTSVYNTGIGAGAGIAQAQIGASATMGAASLAAQQSQWEFGMMEPYLKQSMEPVSQPGKK